METTFGSEGMGVNNCYKSYNREVTSVTDHSSRGDLSLLTDTQVQLHSPCPQGSQPEDNNIKQGRHMESSEIPWEEC